MKETPSFRERDPAQNPTWVAPWPLGGPRALSGLPFEPPRGPGHLFFQTESAQRPLARAGKLAASTPAPPHFLAYLDWLADSAQSLLHT